MSGAQLNLDAIEARAKAADETGGPREWWRAVQDDVPALVAEVRRLRVEYDRLYDLVPRGTFAFEPCDPNADYECCASGSCEVCRR